MRFISRYNRHPVAESKALKLKNLANKVINGVCCHSSFFVIMKTAMNCSPTFGKENGVSFLDVQMADTLENMVSFAFLTGKSFLTYQCCIQVAKFHLQCSNNRNIVQDKDGDETGAETLVISHLDDWTMFSSWEIEESPLIHATSK